jgi:hypothetical protein
LRFFSMMKMAISLTFFHVPDRPIGVVRTTGYASGTTIHQTRTTKGIEGPHGCTLYIFVSSSSCIQLYSNTVPSYLLPFPRTFNCTSKTTGWFTKGAIDPTCPRNKVLLKVAHAFLYTLMDFFQSHQTVTVAILPSSIFPNVQLH